MAGLLAGIVVLTIAISAMCSLFEAILYSTRMGLLEAEAKDGAHADAARRMILKKGNISMPIAAILILNTLAHTVGATFSGMVADELWSPLMVTIFSVVFTLGILILSEIVPKTVGATYWRALWPMILWPLTAMEYLLYPLIVITEGITRLITGGKAAGSIVTEDEILGVTRLGAQRGEISKWESLMVHNIIDLENHTLRQVMTPRVVVFSLDESMTVGEALMAASGKGFSRIPVYRQSVDHLTGYIMIHDLVAATTEDDRGAPLSSIAHEMPFLPESMNCLAALAALLKGRHHIAAVEDEFAGVAGIVSLEDLLESVLGTEIVDEQDRVVDLQELARQRCRATDAKDIPDSRSSALLQDERESPPQTGEEERSG